MSWASSRSSCWCPTSPRSSPRWPAAPRPSSAWRRSTSAVRPWSGPRPRITPTSRWSPARCSTPRCWARRAAGAFPLTARYDSAVASWFASSYAPDEPARENGWPDFLGDAWSRSDILRYGENPHQRAALYVRAAAGPDSGSGGIATAEQLHGKAMSYNNYVDADAARRAAYDFAEPCVAIIKHSNPCGIAIGADLAEAHRKANACDPQSAYGGGIAVNGPVTVELARQIAEIFTQGVVAPAYDDQAREILSQKKNIRLLECPPPDRGSSVEWRRVSGGLLVQCVDRVDQPGDAPANWELKTGVALDELTLADLA